MISEKKTYDSNQKVGWHLQEKWIEKLFFFSSRNQNKRQKSFYDASTHKNVFQLDGYDLPLMTGTNHPVTPPKCPRRHL